MNTRILYALAVISVLPAGCSQAGQPANDLTSEQVARLKNAEATNETLRRMEPQYGPATFEQVEAAQVDIEAASVIKAFGPTAAGLFGLPKKPAESTQTKP